MNKKMIIIIAGASLIVLAATIPVLVIFVGENEPPKISSYSPYYFAVVSGITEIHVEAVDEGENPSGMGSYKIYIDDELVSKENTYSWDTTIYEDGSQHIILVKFYDKKRNMGVWENRVTVDNTIDPPPTDVFKVMNYNIWESGKHEGWYQNVLDEDADIIVLVETGTLDTLFSDFDGPFEMIKGQLNGYFYNKAPYDGRLEQDIWAETDGEGLLSRYPIINFTQVKDYRLDDGSIHHYHHDFCDTVVDINGIVTHIIGYHGKCCQPSATDNTVLRRENETQGIINYMDDLGDVPVMFIGDFNSHSPDDVGDLAPNGWLGDGPIRMLLRPDDPVYGNYSSHVHNFTDTFRTMYPTEQGYTYGFMSQTGESDDQYWGRIDYIFVNHHWADKMINGTVGDTPGAELGSDHYTVDCFFSLDEEYSFFDSKNPSRQPLSFKPPAILEKSNIFERMEIVIRTNNERIIVSRD